MAAKRTTVGLNHPTVIPANFEPETADAERETERCPVCGRRLAEH